MRFVILFLLLIPFFTFADKKGKNEDRKKEKELVGVVTGAVCGIRNEVCSHPRGQGYELVGILDRRKGFFYIANVPQEVLEKFFGEEIKVEGEVYRERATVIAKRILKVGTVIWEEGKGSSSPSNPK